LGVSSRTGRNDIEVIELKGYTREQTMLLMNAVNLLLVTSRSESGPNVTKEALACNLPVISTKVGHPKILNLLENTEGCFVTDTNQANISNAIEKVFERNKRTESREKILIWDINKFADKTISIYNMVISQSGKGSDLPKVVFP